MGVEKSKPYSEVDEGQIGAFQQIKSSSSQRRVPTRKFAAFLEAGDNLQVFGVETEQWVSKEESWKLSIGQKKLKSARPITIPGAEKLVRVRATK